MEILNPKGEEQLEKIREILLSRRKFYQKIMDIRATPFFFAIPPLTRPRIRVCFIILSGTCI